MSKIYLQRITDGAIEPCFATDHAACMDVCADTLMRLINVHGRDIELHCISGDVTLEPGERALIPTGFNMCCDVGFRIAMYPRSGLAVGAGLTLSNCVGVIDADYRGEVMIPIINMGHKPVTIPHGTRIAQLALERLEPTEVVIGTLPETNSNRDGGFGSTGK